MNIAHRPSIRETVMALLAERGKSTEIGPDDSLFVSGLLDSLAATELLMMLESRFDVDLSDADFDISALDTISDLEGLVGVRH